MIERLFQRSPDVRQAWIVVEWLERNAQDELGEFYEQVQWYITPQRKPPTMLNLRTLS